MNVGDLVMAFTEKGEMMWEEVVLVDDGVGGVERQMFTIELEGHP